MSTFHEFKEHFPETTSKSLVNFVNNVVLKHSRYIFTWREGRKQFGYCTHCQSEFITSDHDNGKALKHGQTTCCPNCKSKCGVQASGISRKYMRDYAAFVWYEKSVIDRQAITARVIRVYRDYSGDYRSVKTMFQCSDMYLFEQGKSTYYRYEWGGWEKRKKVFSAFDSTLSGEQWQYKKKFHSLANIRRAVKGTVFQYSTWERYVKYRNPYYVSDMVEFFDLAARYPCIEYLTKLGFEKLVWAKLYGENTYGAVNWRGKTIEKVLRLNKQEIREIRRKGLVFGPNELKFYQMEKKAGKKTTIEDALVLAPLQDSYYQSLLKGFKELAPLDKIIQYLLKQYRKGKKNAITSILSDWRDYQQQCKQLGMSLKEERYLFPNDLHTAHQKITLRIKLKNNPHLAKLIRERVPQLSQLRFEKGGFLARPIESLEELFQEGQALIHCVGQYAERYAQGETNIFVVRKLSDPSKPFYTMQFTGTKLIQCRGYDNCDMTKDVQAFVNQFVVRKLKAKKRTKKMMNQQTNTQGVAV